MDKVIRKVDNDGYSTEYVDYKDMVYKLDEIVEGYNEIMRRLDGIEDRLDGLGSIIISGRNEY